MEHCEFCRKIGIQTIRLQMCWYTLQKQKWTVFINLCQRCFNGVEAWAKSLKIEIKHGVTSCCRRFIDLTLSEYIGLMTEETMKEILLINAIT